MKRFLLSTFALLLAVASSQISAQSNSGSFPKCGEICDRFYNCTLEVHPTATDVQKNTLKKACDAECAKPKYYGTLTSCLEKSGGSCKPYSDCIQNSLKGSKKK